MMIFTKTGATARDFWLADNSATFAVFPANTISLFNRDLPIRLHVGNQAYGACHIEKHWVPKTARQRTIPELIYHKLGQSGTIYNTENSKKLKITMGLSPGGLMVMEYRYQQLDEQTDEYLSITTFYGPQRSRVDGMVIGRYPGRPRPGEYSKHLPK